MHAGRGPLPRTLLLLGGASLLASCVAIAWTATGSNAQQPTALAAAPTPSIQATPSNRASAATQPAACSPDMVLVERTCVDRYEAHLLEPAPDGSLVVHPPHEPPAAQRYVAASRQGQKPQAYICQVDAAAACENAGKRLCTLTEWYRACTGPTRTIYPYGAHYEKGRCNVGKPHLLSLLHGANPNGWSYADFNDPRLSLTDGFLAPSGEYPGCTTTEGAADMVGNLHEWVADRVDGTLRSKLPVPSVTQRRIGKHPGNGIFMGGFFSTLSQHGDGCQFITAAHDPRYHDYSTGFRCCKDAAMD